jgi:sterol 3beta-glucosyltransferase
VVCPFVADQPFWARLAHQRGTAPPPLPYARLDTTRLADALSAAVTDPNLARNAHRLGERVRAEDGVATAVEALERIHRRNT